MATVVKRGSKFRAIVRKGVAVPLTKTFDTRKEAQEWGDSQDVQITQRAKFGCAHKLGEIIQKFSAHLLEKRPYKSDVTETHLRMLARNFSHVDIASIDADWWIKAVEGFNVGPSSAKRYIGYVKSALKLGEVKWGVSVDWDGYRKARAQMDQVNMCADSEARDRRLEPGELERIKGQFKTVFPMGDIVDFALLTALRLNELCTIKWEELDREQRMIWVRSRKHPKKKMTNHSHLPLLGNALDIIMRQPRRVQADGTPEPRIFPFNSRSVADAFREACKRAEVKNFHFHDLRHEAISRLFEQGFAIPEVALVSGHRNWKNLQRYTNLKPHNIHNGPMAHRENVLKFQRKAAA
jgi:integrase